MDFIPVVCILLGNVHDNNLSDIYLQSQLRVLYWCYYICLYHNMFRPLRAIIRRIQYIILFLNIFEKAIVITTEPLFINLSLIKKKVSLKVKCMFKNKKCYIVFTWGWPVGTETCCDTDRYNNINNKLLVAIAGICLKDSYELQWR
jgi:hypothetical protein